MCTRHIWNGMGENASRKPLNPSPVTESISYPSDSRKLRPSRYALVVSVSKNPHQRFSFLFGSLNAITHQLVFSLRSPKYKASATICTFLGKWVFAGAVYELRTSFNVLLSL